MENLLKEIGLHHLRVSYLMMELAVHLEMDEYEQKKCFIAGSLHDIGKYIVDKKVLAKPTKLTQHEMDHIKTHVEFGFQNTAGMDHEIWLGICEHHENYNGTGYPMRIKSDAISQMGRMLRIVDAYDALRSKRAYKTALSYEKTIEIMEKESDYFDPFILSQFKIMTLNRGADEHYMHDMSVIEPSNIRKKNVEISDKANESSNERKHCSG